MCGSKTIFISRGTWTNHELHAFLIKKTPAFVTSFTKYRLCLSLCCNHLCVGSQFYTHKVAIFISVYINGIKMGIWNRFINKTKKLSGPLQCSKPKLTLKFFVTCQPEFAWLRSFIMPWPLCKCHGATVLQWLCCTVPLTLWACINPALGCNDLCDQVMSVEGQRCAYATLFAQVSSWTYLSQGGRQIILISIETKNHFPPVPYAFTSLLKIVPAVWSRRF